MRTHGSSALGLATTIGGWLLQYADQVSLALKVTGGLVGIGIGVLTIVLKLYEIRRIRRLLAESPPSERPS